MKEVVRTDAAPAPFQGAPYSQAIKAAGLVFVAGQVGIKPGASETVGDSIQEQTEQALQNLGAILETAGSGLDRLEAPDAADVATVLGNLVDNALEHAPRGTAPTPWVRVRVRQDQSTVEIVVTDSGPGMPDDLVGSVFEHGVTSKRVDPMEHGVGLALTRLVCRRRGGEITVERADGTTSFVARLGVSTVAETVAAETFS